MSGPLEGRVALVTGASRGIGRAIARDLASAGARLAALSTDLAGTAALVSELLAAGLDARSFAADVGDPGSVTAALDEVERALGPVDVLVNNAGIVRRLALSEMTDEDFDAVLRVNLQGAFYFARRLLPKMVERGFGRLINISSISGTLGTPKLSGYCASKWGLNGLTRALAEEVRGCPGVFVAAVLPGSVDTDMLKGSGFEAAMQPGDVARVVRFLSTEAPPAMSGSLVQVFG